MGKTGVYKRGASAAAVPTWNPSDKSAGITLTVGNTVATSATGTYQGVRSITSHSTGKWYFELAIGAATFQAVGIAPSTWAMTTGNYIGFDGSGVGILDTGTVNYGSGTAGIAGFATTSGDVLQVAVDLDAHKIWFGKNNTWSNSGDPATGTNANVKPVPTATFFVGAGFYTPGSKFGPITYGSLSFSPPSGFTFWG